MKTVLLSGCILLSPLAPVPLPYLQQCSAEDFFEAERGLDAPNHLTPIDPRLSEYDKRVAEHLFLTSGRYGRFVERSSFGLESCVSVHDTGSGATLKYWITVTRASDSLWYSMAKNNREKKTTKVKIIREDREIGREMAVAIQRAWGRMLLLTRYPPEATRVITRQAIYWRLE